AARGELDEEAKPRARVEALVGAKVEAELRGFRYERERDRKKSEAKAGAEAERKAKAEARAQARAEAKARREAKGKSKKLQTDDPALATISLPDLPKEGTGQAMVAAAPARPPEVKPTDARPVETARVIVPAAAAPSATV